MVTVQDKNLRGADKGIAVEENPMMAREPRRCTSSSICWSWITSWSYLGMLEDRTMLLSALGNGWALALGKKQACACFIIEPTLKE